MLLVLRYLFHTDEQTHAVTRHAITKAHATWECAPATLVLAVTSASLEVPLMTLTIMETMNMVSTGTSSFASMIGTGPPAARLFHHALITSSGQELLQVEKSCVTLLGMGKAFSVILISITAQAVSGVGSP